MSESVTPQNGAVPRRDFLKVVWGAAGVAALGEGLFLGLRFLSPRVVEGEFGGVFSAGPVESFPPGSVTPFEAGRFYLVRMQDGGFMAVYRRCTHLGCAVPYDAAAGRFVCPCHGSAFELDGAVVNPPAPRPLDLFTIRVENGSVLVDTGAPIERDRASAGDITYP
jgi:cytochrome b6-f complex iron-sulfur subunit